MKLLYLVAILSLFNGCTEITHESRELPTKYPDTATHGSAYDASEELNKN